MTAGRPRLNVHTAGEGPRRLCLLHCALSHGRAWSGVVRRLGPGFHCVMPDLPGHGHSPDWTGAGDITDHTVAALADLLDGPVDLVGHSFGAVAMLRLAMERPDLCRSLTLVEPVLFAAAAETPQVRGYFQSLRPFHASLAAGDREDAARRFNEIWGALPWQGLTASQQREQMDRIHLVAAFAPAVEEDAAGLLSPGRLEGLDRPVLLVEGAASPPPVGPIHAALEARLSRVERAVIEGARHMAPISHASQVAQRLRAFLDGVEG